MGLLKRPLKVLLGVLALGSLLIPALGLSEEEPASPSPAVETVETAPVPGKKAKRPKYKRSRHTSDESEAKADRRNLLLATGEDRAVDLDFDTSAKDIVIGNPGVVATSLAQIGEKRQIVFKPLKAGDTTVTVRDPQGDLKLVFTVRVTGNNLLRISGELRTLLRDVEGVEIRVVGQRVVLEGEVLVPTDYARVYTVVNDESYKPHVMSMVTISPMALQVMAKRIQDDVNLFAPNVKARVVNNMILMEGNVDSKADMDRVMKVASLYVPEVRPPNPLSADRSAQTIQPGRHLVQNLILINQQPPKKQESKMVRVTVHFVELSKDYVRVFGFKWQPGFTADPQIAFGQTSSGAVGTSNGTTSFTGTISSLLPRLESAQKAGYARILRTATVVVRSGQPAKLNEGQENVYMSMASNGQQTPSSVGVGLALAVTPLVIGQTDDIQLDLNLSQKAMARRAPAGASAAVSTHSVETKIYVKSRESAAVAGVTSNDVGTDFNKDDPDNRVMEGSTTALFNLQRSKNYRKNKSQFVVFVTPEIIENASEGTEDLKKNFRVKLK